jgi:hypothetical protein
MLDLPNHLNPDQMGKLVKVIAEISERSYRRGWQQGIYCAENSGDYCCPADIRYSITAAWSPNPETGIGGTPAIDRLYIEEADYLLNNAGISFEPIMDKMIGD